jgi:uncharacterized protein (DUF1778 family)
MPTKNPRINVTFEEPIAKLLSSLANHEHKSLSSMVKELALEALERREDKYLSTLATKLDADDTKTYSHSEAWK